MLDTQTRLALLTGAQIPQFGFGVWEVPAGATTHNSVTAALELGYRHVDTARIYGNEADVGAAIRASSVPRDQVFVTTKLWNDGHGYDTALRELDVSLGRLGMDYVDLYLIHWPVPEKLTAAGTGWKAEQVPMASRRPQLIEALKELYPGASPHAAVSL